MSDTAALIQGSDRWLLAFQTAAKADPCFGAARFCRGARKASMLPARRLACSRTGATCVGDRKGVGLMFPRWPWILCGNTSALGDACGSSGKPHAAREPHLGREAKAKESKETTALEVPIGKDYRADFA